MSWVFCVSVFTPLGVRSTRTANPVMAFAKANHFPSAIACWEIEGDEKRANSLQEATVHSASFNNREELNKFFDFIRRGYPDNVSSNMNYSRADTTAVKEHYDEVHNANRV